MGAVISSISHLLSTTAPWNDVTSILGFIIMNIIWIVGNENMNEQPHTSITQTKENVGNDKKIANNQLFVSYPQVKRDY